MIETVLTAFGIDALSARTEEFGSGLINNTWKIAVGENSFILQRINTAVFHHPEDIAYNIQLIGDYLQLHHPDYFFVRPLPAKSGEVLVKTPDGYFRLMPFVRNSHTIDTVGEPSLAYEAARQFGRFSRLVGGVDSKRVRVTIPGFHDLSLRFTQFQEAVKKAHPDRVREAREWITEAQQGEEIVAQFARLKKDPRFRMRIMHHDTKISNVLFDVENRGLCVIDLDTVMPGYFISDLGDMMRTYLSPVSEEEADLNKILVRKEIFDAIVEGYGEEMGSELTVLEKSLFTFAGQFMIYMQALRFLADFLLGDIYYGAKYPGHNLVRAKNQLTLLSRLEAI